MTMNIPPAPTRRRQITPNISTSSVGTTGVTAKYSGPFGVFTAHAPDEVQALLALLEHPVLAACDSFDQLVDVIAALQATTPATPWEQQPIGLRGRKPKRPRYKWTITLPDGKKKLMHIYKDTLRPHRDPNCACEICTAMNANPPTPEEAEEE